MIAMLQSEIVVRHAGCVMPLWPEYVTCVVTA